MKAVKRIIVVDLLYLGDLLFAHPFFEGLREMFPEARIDLVANSNFSEIMRANDNIDHVYSYNKNWTAARSYSFAKKLKMNNYHLGINIHGNWRTALLLKLISAEQSIGYGGKGRGVFLDEEVEKDISSHMIEFYLDFLEQMQQSQLLEQYFAENNELQNKIKLENSENKFPVLEFDDVYQQNADLKLKNIGLEDEEFIVLNTGGSWKTKRWPEEYFAEVADHLAVKGYKILFVGGASDTERVNYICNKIDNQKMIYNLSGKTSLLELAAILKKTQLMISGDTGPVHVAAAVGTNTAAIFGPSDEEMYAPRGQGKNILFKNVDLNCRPCGEHECPLDHFKCMRELSPKMIIQRLEAEGMI
ncbi:ADP-heptose--lipooligosaccharide heptosyltransferase II [Halanaerobium saccharolyticum subsp. saccharolyticum DSM 6643]|uniref:lipopolysaccharide heptosyltransferase II n=1 Tax=Halanaerobium saccharolyticum subsp. saccharolyticum DSM 6643 TaxID=1293054 RepID=M5E3A6_9FIRM|nr:lipopolysaccharide heptosyltransferase II [Halanaerobium saccharolyticum]CCU81053.1 ADP-heptose--lipooligosaccharide heptosyltransferase II [Halanaerobium saccharolyticum subsp. saccharolyticum DSM 6643]